MYNPVQAVAKQKAGPNHANNRFLVDVEVDNYHYVGNDSDKLVGYKEVNIHAAVFDLSNNPGISSKN